MRPGVSRALVAVVFVLSRILYFLAGIRFDASPVTRGWQLIDPQFMQHDLLRSLWYLHMQPPGFNLFIGLVVKCFPESYEVVLQLLYVAMGAAIALGLLILMDQFRVPVALATVLTALFIASPGFVLFENFASYEFPTLILLVYAAVALFRFAQAPAEGRSFALFGLVLALCLMRNQFHLIFLVLFSAALWLTWPRARKAILLGAVPAIAILLGIYVKNWILFGAFTSSTWAGMASGVTTTFQLRPDEADDLVRRGVLTPLAKVPPFSELSEYQGFIEMPPKTGIPVLDEAQTSGIGHPNFNNLAYLKVHDQYLKNSVSIWKHYPIAYIRSEMIAWFAYFLPASDVHSFDVQRRKIQPFDRIFSAVMFGQFRQADSRKDLRAINASGSRILLVLYTGTFLIILLPALIIWTLIRFAVPRLRQQMSKPEAATLAFIVFSILFTTAVSNLLSSFENNRYRFPLDGFFVLLTAMAANAIWHRIRYRKTHSESTTPSALPARV